MQGNWLLLDTGMELPIVGGLREVMRCVEPLLRFNISLQSSEGTMVRAHPLSLCLLSPVGRFQCHAVAACHAGTASVRVEKAAVGRNSVHGSSIMYPD